MIPCTARMADQGRTNPGLMLVLGIQVYLDLCQFIRVKLKKLAGAPAIPPDFRHSHVGGNPAIPGRNSDSCLEWVEIPGYLDIDVVVSVVGSGGGLIRPISR